MGCRNQGHNWSALIGPGNRVRLVVFAPDGKKLASTSDDQPVCLWDAKTGSSLEALFEGHRNFVCSVAFSPDEKKLAPASHDTAVVRWWYADTGTTIQILDGHDNYVLSVVIYQMGTHWPRDLMTRQSVCGM